MGNELQEQEILLCGTTATSAPQGRRVQSMPSLQILIENEILTEDTCGCLTRIIHFYNRLYRFGFLFAYMVLVLLTMIVAPVFGIIGGILEWAVSILRLVIRPIGKLIADLIGYGTTASLYNEKLSRELNV